jgi:glycosyltransferase involved in cell wall biosynthesis
VIPAIAIIANAPAPYRLALHRRLIAGVPEVKLFTVFSHDQPEKEQPWDLTGTEDINPVRFGIGESCAQAPKPEFAKHEWRKGGRMIRWFKEQNIRAVFVCGYNDPARLRVIWWCRRNRVPVFIVSDSNIHGERARGWRKIVKHALVRSIIKLCTGFLPCGTSGAAYFKKYGARDEQIYFLPYEPDYSIIRGVTEDKKREVAAKFGLDPTRRRIMFIGRLVEAKRPDLALDGFGKIAAEQTNWDLLMVGDGPLRASLENGTPTDLRGRVTWTGFVSDPSVVAALYHLSDVFLLPSEYEPWGVVVNEAAAVPLAMCVSHVVGAAPELVKDGENGRIFTSGDAAGLERALRETTDDQKIDAYRRASTTVLEGWRRGTDPAESLRRALREAGVLTNSA